MLINHNKLCDLFDIKFILQTTWSVNKSSKLISAFHLLSHSFVASFDFLKVMFCCWPAVDRLFSSFLSISLFFFCIRFVERHCDLATFPSHRPKIVKCVIHFYLFRSVPFLPTLSFSLSSESSPSCSAFLSAVAFAAFLCSCIIQLSKRLYTGIFVFFLSLFYLSIFLSLSQCFSGCVPVTIIFREIPFTINRWHHVSISTILFPWSLGSLINSHTYRVYFRNKVSALRFYVVVFSSGSHTRTCSGTCSGIFFIQVFVVSSCNRENPITLTISRFIRSAVPQLFLDFSSCFICCSAYAIVFDFADFTTTRIRIRFSFSPLIAFALTRSFSFVF